MGCISLFLQISVLVSALQPFASTGLFGLGAVMASVDSQAIEERLAQGAASLVRTTHIAAYRFVRLVKWSAKRWVSWAATLLLVTSFSCLAIAVDADAVRTWRGQGFAACRASVALAVAVYLRLIVDPRAPILGKALLLCGLIYSVMPQDLMPDTGGAAGLVDDLAASWLAARGFMGLCPRRLVEGHAARASRVRRHLAAGRFSVGR